MERNAIKKNYTLQNIATIATVLFVFGLIMTPWIMGKMKTRQKMHHYPDTPPDASMTILDKPVSFGYKCMWFAIKSANHEKLIKVLNLTNILPCNWQTGIEKAYSNYVFITPPIDGWTIACGLGLPPGDTREGIDDIKEILQDLSREYGEAQFFCTHRVTEYHCWMKAIDGSIERIYSYLGEAGENIVIEGEATDFEKILNLADTFSAESKEENYFERKDITWPDEETVMKVAENWSIDPSALEIRKDIPPELGLLGEC
jgi:hypothetical protein